MLSHSIDTLFFISLSLSLSLSLSVFFQTKWFQFTVNCGLELTKKTANSKYNFESTFFSLFSLSLSPQWRVSCECRITLSVRSIATLSFYLSFFSFFFISLSQFHHAPFFYYIKKFSKGSEDLFFCVLTHKQLLATLWKQKEREREREREHTWEQSFSQERERERENIVKRSIDAQ